MPTMMASTITLMPELTTLPRTRSARKLVRFQSANGTRMKPASVVSLNSRIVTNICTARIKKARTTITQATNSTTMVRKLSKKVVKQRECLTCRRNCQAAEKTRRGVGEGRGGGVRVDTGG